MAMEIAWESLEQSDSEISLCLFTFSFSLCSKEHMIFEFVLISDLREKKVDEDKKERCYCDS